MTEEEFINQYVLEQLGEKPLSHAEEKQRYEKAMFQRRYERGNYDSIVNDVARKIANAAFSSNETQIFYRVRESSSGILDALKASLSKPAFKEGLIIAAVMAFKMGLWFSYRKASENGLEIAEL